MIHNPIALCFSFDRGKILKKLIWVLVNGPPPPHPPLSLYQATQFLWPSEKYINKVPHWLNRAFTVFTVKEFYWCKCECILIDLNGYVITISSDRIWGHSIAISSAPRKYDDLMNNIAYNRYSGLWVIHCVHWATQ